MEKMIIQEPCCIEQILPRTLKWDENTFWQTNGDVTFGLVMKAVSYLAGNEINVKVVTPVFSLRMARFMAWYWRREWLKGFSLLTKEAVGSDVWAELREMGDVVGDVVTHKNVNGSEAGKSRQIYRLMFFCLDIQSRFAKANVMR